MPKFELEPYNRNVSDEKLIADLKRIALKLGKDFVTHHEYNEYGEYYSGTIVKRFGSWFNASQKAGLKCARSYGMPNDEFFKNLEEVWIKLGRQPHYDEMRLPFSKYTARSYARRFGTWHKALERFIEYINKEEVPQVEEKPIIENKVIATEKESVIKHKTKRNISERLKVQVLMRDGNK